jgi:cytoskeletal protein RodZ
MSLTVVFSLIAMLVFLGLLGLIGWLVLQIVKLVQDGSTRLQDLQEDHLATLAGAQEAMPPQRRQGSSVRPSSGTGESRADQA